MQRVAHLKKEKNSFFSSKPRLVVLTCMLEHVYFEIKRFDKCGSACSAEVRLWQLHAEVLVHGVRFELSVGDERAITLLTLVGTVTFVDSLQIKEYLYVIKFF